MASFDQDMVYDTDTVSVHQFPSEDPREKLVDDQSLHVKQVAPDYRLRGRPAATMPASQFSGFGWK